MAFAILVFLNALFLALTAACGLTWLIHSFFAGLPHPWHPYVPWAFWLCLVIYLGLPTRVVTGGGGK